MKILVTGGSGFIGKAFIKQYRNKFDIVAPTHAQMDLKDARAIDRFFGAQKFDAVVHLAGTTERGDLSAIEVDNLIMFKNIQYMSIAHGVKKLIIVGEGSEFDRNKPIVDITEDMIGKAIPVDGYGLGKYLINVLAAKDKITTNLRIFSVYGAGGSREISKIIAAGAKGKKSITIDRDRTVSGVYIDDATRVIAEFLRGDLPMGDYNLVSGDKTSYLAVAKQVKRLVRKEGGDIEIKVKSEGEDYEYTASNEKLLSVLPIRFTPFATGVKKTFEELKPKKRIMIVAGDDEE